MSQEEDSVVERGRVDAFEIYVDYIWPVMTIRGFMRRMRDPHRVDTKQDFETLNHVHFSVDMIRDTRVDLMLQHVANDKRRDDDTRTRARDTRDKLVALFNDNKLPTHFKRNPCLGGSTGPVKLIVASKSKKPRTETIGHDRVVQNVSASEGLASERLALRT